MKRAFAVFLAVCLLMGLTVPTFATDEPAQDEPQPEQVVVSTLEELQAAIATAEDGDTIYISSMIIISDAVVETDKEITLTRADEYDSSAFIRLSNGGKLRGFKLTESKNVAVEVYFTPDKAAVLDNCAFIGGSENNSALINIWGGNASVEITNCSFDKNGYTAITSKANTIAEISNCTFSENSTQGQGGAIGNAGTMTLSDCSITDNRPSQQGLGEDHHHL